MASSGVSTDGDVTSAGGVRSGRGGASWYQLWRQLAQRTVRPVVPIALSGTR
jgi:hypothetical protein